MNAAVTLIALLSLPVAPGSALVPDPVEPGDPSALGIKMGELLRGRLEAAGVATVTAEEALVRATGEGESAAFVRAKAALKRGKEHYLQLELDKALAALSEARRDFQRVLLEGGVFETFAETLAYLGATHLALGNANGAEESFVELVRVRPAFELDAAVYPPEVLAAYEAARVKATAMKRAPLNILSAPPLAHVFVDGTDRGKTPVTVDDLIIGPHAVRVEVEGRLPWWGMVEVLDTGTRVKVRLEQDLLQARLGAFVDVVSQASARGDVVARARQLANAARTEAVVAMGFIPDAAGFIVSVALLPTDGELRVVWTVIDGDFFQAEEGAAALVKTLLATRSATPVFVPIGHTATRQPDFDASLLGLPGRKTAIASPTRTEPVATGRSGAEVVEFADPGDVDVPEESAGVPGWVWIAASTGVVVVALAAGGAAFGYYWFGVPAPTEQLPDTVKFEAGMSR